MVMKIFVVDESDSAKFGKQLLGGVACEKTWIWPLGLLKKETVLSWVGSCRKQELSKGSTYLEANKRKHEDMFLSNQFITT